MNMRGGCNWKKEMCLVGVQLKLKEIDCAELMRASDASAWKGDQWVRNRNEGRVSVSEERHVIVWCVR